MRGRGRWAVFVVGIVLAAGLWIVTNRNDDSGPSSPVETQAADEIAHVHGLGINPADGDLYVATHYGVYRVDVDSGSGRRVGDLQQDTMGFTIAGANHFLASGHPEFRATRRISDRRPLLGLIESRDAGRTWKELSLGGEADFHGLSMAHGLVYGWSSTTGEFMVSSDRRTWDRRSTVAIASFAVDPAERDHLVASDERGAIRSRDGGRTWERTAGAPNAFLAWGEGGNIWSARFDDGALARSRDAGATWQSLRPLPGRAGALLRHGRDLYAAVADVGLLRSRDDGETWSAVYKAR